MRIATLPAALLAIQVCASPFVIATTAVAQVSAHSSLEDQQRFVSLVHRLESAPLDPSLRDNRAWAVQWLEDAPNVMVSACLDPLGGVSISRYTHSDEIIVQYMLGMGAFIIENPGKVHDHHAQQLAGVESALNAYQSIRAVQSDDQSPALESLLAMQLQGELPAFVQKAFHQCLAKDGK